MAAWGTRREGQPSTPSEGLESLHPSPGLGHRPRVGLVIGHSAVPAVRGSERALTHGLHPSALRLPVVTCS